MTSRWYRGDRKGGKRTWTEILEEGTPHLSISPPLIFFLISTLVFFLTFFYGIDVAYFEHVESFNRLKEQGWNENLYYVSFS